MLLTLLRLPIELLRIAFYAVRGLVDRLRGRKRLRVEFTVLIDAPRDAVWRFSTADRVVFDGPPLTELVREPVPGSEGLSVTRVSLNGQPRMQLVSRELERDDVKGRMLGQIVPHELSQPPGCGNDCLTGLTVEQTAKGTALTVFNELTMCSFRERIVYPVGLQRRANQVKQQCEKEAGIRSRLARLTDHWLVLSSVALVSFGIFWAGNWRCSLPSP